MRAVAGGRLPDREEHGHRDPRVDRNSPGITRWRELQGCHRNERTLVEPVRQSADDTRVPDTSVGSKQHPHLDGAFGAIPASLLGVGGSRRIQDSRLDRNRGDLVATSARWIASWSAGAASLTGSLAGALTRSPTRSLARARTFVVSGSVGRLRRSAPRIAKDAGIDWYGRRQNRRRNRQRIPRQRIWLRSRRYDWIGERGRRNDALRDRAWIPVAAAATARITLLRNPCGLRRDVHHPHLKWLVVRRTCNDDNWTAENAKVQQYAERKASEARCRQTESHGPENTPRIPVDGIAFQ